MTDGGREFPAPDCTGQGGCRWRGWGQGMRLRDADCTRRLVVGAGGYGAGRGWSRAMIHHAAAWGPGG